MISFSAEQRFIVTGASSGIGESVALLLNRLGATVIGVGRNSERLEAMKAKAERPESVFIESKDLTEEIENLPAYIKTLKDKYGKFQGLAYCAGISYLKPFKIWEKEDAQKAFDINYFAPLSVMSGFADKRICNGKGSACVFISSAAAVLSDKGQTIYAGTKAALSASVRVIAKELSAQGIRANCILPTIIKTPMSMNDWEYAEEQLKRYPMGFGEVSDVANMTAFLLSDKAKWITGQNYIIDCGSF